VSSSTRNRPLRVTAESALIDAARSLPIQACVTCPMAPGKSLPNLNARQDASDERESTHLELAFNQRPKRLSSRFGGRLSPCRTILPPRTRSLSLISFGWISCCFCHGVQTAAKTSNSARNNKSSAIWILLLRDLSGGCKWLGRIPKDYHQA